VGGRARAERNKIRCPKCGDKPTRTETRYGPRLDCCGLWAWGDHPLADMETHEARKAAHAAFDTLWKFGTISRGHAYKLLAEAMGLSRDDCHMKLMTAEQAQRVPAIAAQIRRGLDLEHLPLQGAMAYGTAPQQQHTKEK
jgi:hypothetical protein